MQITIFAFGSRGDVQPYIPLGMALQQAGYEVTFTVFKLDSACRGPTLLGAAGRKAQGGA